MAAISNHAIMLLLLTMLVSTTLSFNTAVMSNHRSRPTPSRPSNPSTAIFSALASNPPSSVLSANPQKQSNPVVVSEKAEALSHFDTTLRLTPSFDLFQLLPEEEGGERSSSSLAADARREERENQPVDTLKGFKIDFSNLRQVADLPEPFKLVDSELQPFSDSIKELVSSDQPILSMAAKHFFEKRQGKRFRPTIVQLMAKAVAACDVADSAESSIFSSASILSHAVTPENHRGSEAWRRQAQLGQIVEMIHVASLIHDDVLDEAETRRGGDAVHKLYSNKVAVLAGDYLLARASVLLARLENTAVVQIMATALESLVSGEIMQLKSPPETLVEMETYLRKSYYKTASLICYGCR